MTRSTANRGYLRYCELRPAHSGINHQVRNLQCLLLEAHELGRLAVLRPLLLEGKHNGGALREWSWDTYFDLDSSGLVETNGSEYPLPVVRELPSRALKTHVIPPRGRCTVVASEADLVVRQVRHEVFAREVPVTKPSSTFRMRPSATVLDLAGPVIATLRARFPRGYSAVHIRRTDRLWGPMKYLMRPARIRRRMRALGIADGTGVYFLSDERDAAFWSALAPHYQSARYVDFPELKTLVAPGNRQPDNYLLYEVEKEIMRDAATRMETFPGTEYEPSHGTLVPTPMWIVARNVRKGWRRAKRFLRRCIRRVLRVAVLTLRGMGLARPGG